MDRSVPVAPRRAARLLAAALLAAGAGHARASDVRISWDRDLAFEWDRANYEKTLRELVRAGEAEVSSWLGWARTRPLEIQVMTRARFEQEFGSAHAWSAGAHYRRGVVSVNGGARLDGSFAGLLTHEITHAFLDDRGTGQRFPMWLAEGLAERLAYRTRGQHDITTAQRGELEIALDHKELVPLPARGRMTHFRYLQSFAAVLFLEQAIGKEALLRLVRAVMERGTFEEALAAQRSWKQSDLEERFSYWVDHLQ